MQWRNLALGLLGAALATLILAFVGVERGGNCFVRITGESVTVSNCRNLEEVPEVIKAVKGLWSSLGAGGKFDFGGDCSCDGVK
uniref:Movement protein TGBp3 n=1 Tax=Grapevine virus T TaxID=2016035 RepID=A0A3G3LPZ3_9VIRU|nr:triple gene block 3 protein [Grapevine virus T]AYQ96131.1 triple gene block 3 protein [Grapevine virus T]AYQ96136.1 triple gene block 3 protein [Grapevine virus T]